MAASWAEVRKALGNANNNQDQRAAMQPTMVGCDGPRDRKVKNALATVRGCRR